MNMDIKKTGDQQILEILEKIIGKGIKKISNEEFHGEKLNEAACVLDENNCVISLCLSSCELTAIPNEINGLSKLEKLSLRNNKIERISNLNNLVFLRELRLGFNQITKIENLGELSGLKSIHLEYNQINEISGLDYLTELTVLNLHTNQIKKVEKLSELKALENLRLEYNQIEEVEGLGDLKALKMLNFQANKIKKINNLNGLVSLEDLNLSFNKIEKIEGLDNLPKLGRLVLNANKITKIEKLGALQELIDIGLSFNKITKIENLNELKKLIVLLLDSNQIRKIEGLDGLPNLVMLNLNENKIKKIENLKSFLGSGNNKSLYLNSNIIKDATGILELLEMNEYIDVSDIIYVVSERIRSAISLGGNPLQRPPMEIIAQGRDAVLRYFKSLKVAQEPLDFLKIAVIGNATDGKSTLVNCLLDNMRYEKFNKSTEIMRVESKMINGVACSFWDFGGQECFHGTYKLFLDSNIVILVTTKNAENLPQGGRDQMTTICLERNLPKDIEIKHFPPEYWIKLVSKLNKELLVIQNKCDQNKKPLYLNEPYEDIYYLHKLSFEILCNGNGTPDDYNVYSQNWKKFKLNLEKAVKNNNVSHPSDWKKFMYIIHEHKGEGIVKMNMHKLFKEWVNSLAAGKRKDETIILEFMDILEAFKRNGNLVYFFDDRELKLMKNDEKKQYFFDRNSDMDIYINPEYIIDVVHDILDYPSLVRRREKSPCEWGKFSDTDIPSWIKDKQYFLDIMKELRIIFEKIENGKKIYIAPQYLPQLKDLTVDIQKKFREMRSMKDIWHVLIFEILDGSTMVGIVALFAAENEQFFAYNNGILLEYKGGEMVVVIERDFEKDDKFQSFLNVFIKGGNTQKEVEILSKIQEVCKSEKVFVKEVGKDKIRLDEKISQLEKDIRDKEMAGGVIITAPIDNSTIITAPVIDSTINGNNDNK